MKCFKPLFGSLLVSLLTANIVDASALNRVNILPNNIPTAIEFMIVKNGDNSADLFFPKTAVPAHLYCYFAPPNNLRYKGMFANFSSDTANITSQTGAGLELAGGGGEVKILTVQSVAGNSNVGNITITLEGEINVTTATIMCAMQKIK
ncbi:MAG: hypothetical protein V4496_06525 [Pseudomonadota bacterium]